jgi:NADPH:quinone reductase-like Zn-dependent oxidoreductase
MSSTVQTVFRLPSPGSGISSLTLSHEPIPNPLPHELLIKIRSVALNGRDVHVANGSYPLPVKDDVVLGSDMCGIVSGMGSEIKNFKIGDVSEIVFSNGYWRCDVCYANDGNWMRIGSYQRTESNVFIWCAAGRTWE